MRVYVLTESIHYKNGGIEKPCTIGVFDNKHISTEVANRTKWYFEHFPRMQHKEFVTPMPIGKFGVTLWDEGMVITLTAECFDVNK